MFLTRRTLAVLAGGIAFAAAYLWYKKRQRILMLSRSRSRNRKPDEIAGSEKDSGMVNGNVLASEPEEQTVTSAMDQLRLADTANAECFENNEKEEIIVIFTILARKF
ncbi:unnamed protein product [Gongylonema pulchrum]|uniref:Arm_2 domain-containing protein n=1 Tax=Gongylonema pulchrum TaxID=637853 RepID=A0A183DYW2_9BILA|nr:unnamed protein product [Gongylonema pulchrum]